MKLASTLATATIALMYLSCTPVGKPGDACTVSGDGFSRKDSCETTCVNWSVTCPNGATVTPDVCAGAYCSGGRGCPSGFHCLVVDSVPDNARCMPVDICPPVRSFTPASDFGEDEDEVLVDGDEEDV